MGLALVPPCTAYPMRGEGKKDAVFAFFRIFFDIYVNLY